MRGGVFGPRDARLAACLAGLCALFFAGLRLAGRTFFWGDLLYIHFAWREVPALFAQAGALPLWNPFNYLGMPLAAEMQCAAWSPLTLPFHLLGFASALAAFQAAHYALTAVFWLLLLRAWGLSRWASAGGAVAAVLCGVSVSRLGFLNHLTALAFLPAFLLFARSPVLLALSLSLSFTGGYPTMTAGAAAAAFVLAGARSWSAEGPRGLGAHARRWAAGGALAAALSAVLLLPALELASDSRRGGGLEAQEMLTWSFAPRDLLQLSSPALLAPGEFDPAGSWWKTCYWGFAPGALAVVGAAGLGPAGAAAAAAYGAAAAAVVLGGTNPASRAVWTAFPPLRFVRYPGNMAYLFIPLMVLLAARGLDRRRWAVWAVCAFAAELGFYAWGALPTGPSALWTHAGPVARTLWERAAGGRVLVSPRALHWQRASAGSGLDAAAFDLKARLYGLSNAPLGLEEVGGFGEPLVPRRQYEFMDRLFSLQGAAEAARWMPWAGASVLVSREPAAAPGLRSVASALWEVSELEVPAARAYWLEEPLGAALAPGSESLPASPPSRPLSVSRPRATRFSVSGSAAEPGWVYLAEPLGAGWRAQTMGAALEPALGPFWKVRVPAGDWALRFRYDPASFRLGLALTLAALVGLLLRGAARLRTA
ncbi:MAG: hypothetical protein HY928_08540 [Elusimicrobia bacterium]|nr:hypothetical protein [Elusimicrobiota bacterium]